MRLSLIDVGPLTIPLSSSPKNGGGESVKFAWIGKFTERAENVFDFF